MAEEGIIEDQEDGELNETYQGGARWKQIKEAMVGKRRGYTELKHEWTKDKGGPYLQHNRNKLNQSTELLYLYLFCAKHHL